jgi:putative membrane protein
MKQHANHLAGLAAVGLLTLAPLCAQGQGSAQSQSSQGSSQSQSSQGSKSQGSQGSTQSQSSQGAARQSGSASQAHDQTGSANRMSADSSFVNKAAIGGLAEVKLGQLAIMKASNGDVKSFGQQMLDDHGKANVELKDLASKKGITLPTDIDAKHQATYDRLSKLSGAEFDREYMKEMVSDHREDVNEFRRESKSGSDSDVKAWAAKTLPTLEHHLQMAESTNAKVK